MIDSATFWNKAADKYARHPIKNMANYERKLAQTRAHFRPDMRVLEFACGTGSTALLHAPHVASYHAVDISSEMIRIAREKEGAEQVIFEVADFDTMPVAPESVDMVQAHSILHLLPDPNATIRKVFAALTPGGVFVSSTACLRRIWPLRLIAPIGQMLGKFPHIAFFSDDDLRKMMVEAGFEIVEDWQPKGGIAGLFLIVRKPE